MDGESGDDGRGWLGLRHRMRDCELCKKTFLVLRIRGSVFVDVQVQAGILCSTG